MKKAILFIFLLSVFFGAFAETGYNKHAWGTKKSDIKLKSETKPGKDSLWKDTKAENKSILGKMRPVYYHFFNDSLGAISYTLPIEKVKNFQNKMKEKVFETQAESEDIDFILVSCKEEKIIPEIQDIDLDLNKIVAITTLEAENDGYEEIDPAPENAAGRIYIYDYNDDTRVYLYENVVTDYAFVVYVPHEQDF
jgi:hypothetical protein